MGVLSGLGMDSAVGLVFLPNSTKTNLFVCFLEESEDTKNSFRNYLTFVEPVKLMLVAISVHQAVTVLFVLTWSHTPPLIRDPLQITSGHSASSYQLLKPILFLENIKPKG